MKFGLRNLAGLALAGAIMVSLSACNTPQENNAVVGGVMGGTTGAIVGSVASGGQPGAAVAGGLIGAATGAILGAAVTPQGPGYYPPQGPGYYPPPPHACASWYYDYYGNRVCRGYY
jgi:hypothetical protein